MDVFNSFHESNKIQLLPKDGEVEYYGTIFNQSDSDQFYEDLLQHIEWKNDEAMIFGKKIITARKVAWYADSELEYTYSKITKRALLWTPVLKKLKSIVEEKTKATYNSCLCNLYHTGAEGMAYHSDAEKMLVPSHEIASLSFGAERRFLLRHKIDKKTISIDLENGSLLVMKGETQTHWLHRLATTTQILTPRINLTFRKISV